MGVKQRHSVEECETSPDSGGVAPRLGGHTTLQSMERSGSPSAKLNTTVSNNNVASFGDGRNDR